MSLHRGAARAPAAHLASLVAAGELDPQVGWHGGWDRAGEAAEALFSRTVSGKVILDVG